MTSVARVFSAVIFLLSSCIAPQAVAKASDLSPLACSAQQSVANINELNDNNSGAFFDFIEIKILKDNTDIKGWTLCVAENGVQKACATLGLGKGYWADTNTPLGVPSAHADNVSQSNTTVFSANTWIIYGEGAADGAPSDKLRADSNGGEVVLRDDAGNVLDYIAYDKAGESCGPVRDEWGQNRWDVKVSPDLNACGVCFDGKSSSNKNLARADPDGSGSWVDSNNPPTQGESNDTVVGSCALGGFELMPAATALACPQTRAAVGVRALCADLSTTKTDYSGTIELSSDQLGTEFYTGATSASAVTLYNFDGSENGLATLYYSHNDEALVSVSVTDAGPDPAITALGSATDFRAFGFKVDTVASLSACAVSPSYTLTAFGQVEGNAGCEVIEGFGGDKDLKIWSEYMAPASNAAGTQVRVNGIPVATAESSLYSMLFTGGVAPFTLSYPDAGQLKLHFKHEQSPYDGGLYAAMLAETSPFTVIPYGFGISAANAAGALHGGDYTSTQKLAAGAPFELSIQAQCADGTPTPNYQPSNARMTLTQIQSASGSLTLKGGAYLPGAGASDISALFVAGTVTDSAASYSEVGAIQMRVEDSTYLGVPVTTATTVDIGRFHPAYFEVSVLDDGALEAGCGSFVYTGQLTSAGEGAVSYSTSPPRLRIVPRNAAGELTQNYRGDFMRLTAADISITAPDADAGQLGSDALTPMRLTSSVAVGALTEAVEAGQSGYLYYALSGSDHYSYDRDANSQIAPFSADLDLALAEVKDADAVLASGVLPVLKPAGIEVLFGRLRVENAFGPETEALPVLAQTEYFNGIEFVRNVQDSCSPIALDILDPALGRLASGGSISVGSATSVVQLNSSVVDLGDLALAFGAPGLGASGEISFQLSDGGNTLSSGIGSLPWLLFDWDGDGGFDDDPGVRKASFGRYRGHDRVIFWQENFSR